MLDAANTTFLPLVKPFAKTREPLLILLVSKGAATFGRQPMFAKGFGVSAWIVLVLN